MVRHIAYREEQFVTPDLCIQGIRQLLALGWILLELRGAPGGPFLALWRKEDSP